MAGLDAANSTVPRPQPVGVLPLPAGLLVLGPGREADRVRQLLCTGKLPARWPTSLQYMEWALLGELDRAVDCLDDDDDPINMTNRFVLRPEVRQLQRLENLAAIGELPSALAAVVAAVGYTSGLRAAPESPAFFDEEYTALIHLTRAVDHLERGRHDAAASELSVGAAAARRCAPILSVQLLCSLSDLMHHIERHHTFALGHDGRHQPFLAHDDSLLGLWVALVRELRWGRT